MGTYLNVLKNKDFALLWAGQGVSDVGSQINFIALTLLVIDMTGEVVPVSLLFIALALPSVLLGPWAGVLVDRWNKKTVIIISDIIRGVLAIAMAFAPGLVWIYFLAMAQSAAATFFSPAIRTVVPRLVPRQQLLTANALVSGNTYVSRMAGPALGGLIAGLFGVPMAFIVNGISFIVSAAAEAWITVPPGQGETSGRPGLGHDFKQGLNYIRRNRAVKFVIVLFFLAMLPPMGGLNTLQVFLLRDVFAYPEAAYGALMTFYGAGLVAGAVAVGKLSRVSEVKMMVMGLAFYGLFYIGLRFGSVFAIAAVALAAIGFCATLINVSYSTFLQLAVADEMRGRVFSIDIALGNVAWLISVAVTGLLADWLGAANILVVAGLMLVSLMFIVSRLPLYRHSMETLQGIKDAPEN